MEVCIFCLNCGLMFLFAEKDIRYEFFFNLSQKLCRCLSAAWDLSSFVHIVVFILRVFIDGCKADGSRARSQYSILKEYCINN
jgi:hypothetical protein